MAKVWFITGASRGFGRVWAEAALERGDSVAATARDTGTLEELAAALRRASAPLELDVTDKAAIDRSVAAAHERFGRLDVVVNNAGYGQFGAIEEVSEEEARRQIETNLFGPLWVTKAAIPILREQRSGHILQVSSIGGVLAFPILGLYHASKWALEAFSQSLSEELEEFGVKVTIIEPGGYRDRLGGLIRRPQRRAAGLRRRPRTALPAARARPLPAGRPAGDGRGGAGARRRRGPAAARVLRQQRPRDGPPRVRGAPGELGALERPLGARPGRGAGALRADARAGRAGAPLARLTARTGPASSSGPGRPGTAGGRYAGRLPSSTRAL